MGRAANRKRDRKRCRGEHQQAQGRGYLNTPLGYLDAAIGDAIDRPSSDIDAADILAVSFMLWVHGSLDKDQRSYVAGDALTVMGVYNAPPFGEGELIGTNSSERFYRNAWLAGLTETPEGTALLTDVVAALAGACSGDISVAVDTDTFETYHRALRRAAITVPPEHRPNNVIARNRQPPQPPAAIDTARVAAFRNDVGNHVEFGDDSTFADALRAEISIEIDDGAADMDAVIAEREMTALFGGAAALLDGMTRRPELVGAAGFGEIDEIVAGGVLSRLMYLTDHLDSTEADPVRAFELLLSADDTHTAIHPRLLDWCHTGHEDCLGMVALDLCGLRQVDTLEGTWLRIGTMENELIHSCLVERDRYADQYPDDGEQRYGDAVTRSMDSYLDLLEDLGVPTAVTFACSETGFLPAPFGVEIRPERTRELEAAVIDAGGTLEHLREAEMLGGVHHVMTVAAGITSGPEIPYPIKDGSLVLTEILDDPDGATAQLFTTGAQTVPIDIERHAEGAARWARTFGDDNLAAEVADAARHPERPLSAAEFLCYVCADTEDRHSSIV